MHFSEALGTKRVQCEKAVKRESIAQRPRRSQRGEEKRMSMGSLSALLDQVNFKILVRAERLRRSDLRLPQTKTKGRSSHLRGLCPMLLRRRSFSRESRGVHTTCFVAKRIASLLVNFDEGLFPQAIDPSLSRLLPLDLLQFFLDPVANLGKWNEPRFLFGFAVENIK